MISPIFSVAGQLVGLVCRVADAASDRNLHLEWTFVFGFATVGLAEEAHGKHGGNGSAFLRPSSERRRSEDDPGTGCQLWRLDANGIGPDCLGTLRLEAAGPMADGE